ncbi:hypothetical protein BH10BAC2_BH10BAC2_40120 [soil metagenome]
MAQQKIQLRKIRDFGENFSDTFQFLKQELKPLMIAFTMIGVVFAILISLLTILYRNQLAPLQGNINIDGNISYSDVLSVYNGTFFLLMGLAVVAFAAMVTCIAVYMKYYDEHETSPTVNDLWRSFLKYLFRNAVLAIIHMVLFFIGFIFCLAPGFYFLFVLMPFAFIVVNEDLSIGQAFTRCFELIKENFWASTALYIVLGVMVLVISMLVLVVSELVSGAGSLFSLENIQNRNPVVDIIQNVLQYYFYIIIYVSVGLNYYNLVEKRDGAGLARRLDGLGGAFNPNENIEEQY